MEAGKSLHASWTVQGAYDLDVHGPQGLVRHFKGDLASAKTALRVVSRYDRSDACVLL